ncbi:hypothetical protein [Bordetella genomosp. 13]|uniref:hypothetical protein n=1 Tax=Bordetella genomosp. 13 TaxID=463040 RepID=UPI0018DF60DA|nr:hypothetical protein [Bordetella genomosp. 13]
MRTFSAYRWALVAASVVVLNACGGDDDDDDSSSGPPPEPPAQLASCTWNTGAQLAFEERRLDTSLPYTGATVIGTDQTPLATRIVTAAGFQNFAPQFATSLCGDDGKTSVMSQEQAMALVKEKGQELWRAAVDRVQGRRAAQAGETLPQSDDRMLYWTRVQMTKTLRQWAPEWGLSASQMSDLQWEFERASRGQYDIALPEGNAASGQPYRRMIISGFDVFTLGTPGTPNTGLRNGNPSGATALEMDGREYTLSDGSVLRVEAYVLPVSYDPFNRGMQEDTLGPWFQPGPRRVDASLTFSQGGSNIFWLEQWNGRFHGSSAGNDGIVYCPTGTRLPAVILPLGTVTTPGSDPISLPGSGCNTVVQERWLGADSISAWKKDTPPQFTTASLPVEFMLLANTQTGVIRPPGATSAGTEGFDVTWHTNYSYFPNCDSTNTVAEPWHGVVNAMPNPADVHAPDPSWCARTGGGGDYLSNESAYRNTLLRDIMGLSIPAGHVHIPVMNNFYNGTAAAGGFPRDDNSYTDARFEAYRTAIVEQSKKLAIAVGEAMLAE